MNANFLISLFVICAPVFVRVTPSYFRIDYPADMPASNYISYIEYACAPNGPYSYCPDARYQGTNIFLGLRPNHFYRLRCITNFTTQTQ